MSGERIDLNERRLLFPDGVRETESHAMERHFFPYKPEDRILVLSDGTEIPIQYGARKLLTAPALYFAPSYPSVNYVVDENDFDPIKRKEKVKKLYNKMVRLRLRDRDLDPASLASTSLLAIVCTFIAEPGGEIEQKMAAVKFQIYAENFSYESKARFLRHSGNDPIFFDMFYPLDTGPLATFGINAMDDLSISPWMPGSRSIVDYTGEGLNLYVSSNAESLNKTEMRFTSIDS